MLPPSQRIPPALGQSPLSPAVRSLCSALTDLHKPFQVCHVLRFPFPPAFTDVPLSPCSEGARTAAPALQSNSYKVGLFFFTGTFKYF